MNTSNRLGDGLRGRSADPASLEKLGQDLLAEVLRGSATHPATTIPPMPAPHGAHLQGPRGPSPAEFGALTAGVVPGFQSPTVPHSSAVFPQGGGGVVPSAQAPQTSEFRIPDFASALDLSSFLTRAPSTAGGFPVPGVLGSRFAIQDACDPFMFTNSAMDGHHLATAPVPALVPQGNHFYFLAPETAQRPARATAQAPVPTPGTSFDVEAVRRDFPILHKPVNGKPLIWLDNGATTQKPQAVIDAISYFYENDNSNVHRAAHALAARATEAYENARKVVAQFMGAALPEEIIFVRGTTDGMNMAAQTLGGHLLGPGDEILLSTFEHHANIVPWQLIAAKTGAKIVAAPIDDSGQIILEEYFRLLSRRTRIVSISQVSNVLGTVAPLEKMIAPAHEVGAKVVVDGAQSIAHLPVNVSALDADMFVFSGHKIYGPTGVGVVYGKLSLLEELPVYQGGGNMIENVSFEKTTYNKPPAKFEAGTAILAGAVGLASAINYLRQVGFERALAHEDELLALGMKLLSEIPGLRILGTAAQKVAVLSFTMKNLSADDIGRALTAEGIAVRVGHHCAQPVLRRFGLTAVARASLGMYNTEAEVRKLADVLGSLVYRA
jgi:cysteine desulfurase / selenocysteine lyase